MKLLFDENLSRRLVERLADLFPDSTHVAYQELLHAPDEHIWKLAKERGFAIVTADADFYERAIAFGPPPKVVWLSGRDYPTAFAERLIRSQAIRITEFLQDNDQAVLVLTP